MGTFTWFDGMPPEDLKIRQVYGILFTTDGRVLLCKRQSAGGYYYSLIGGKPETFDKDEIATLRRECLEEANTSLTDKIEVAGYQLVDEGNGTPLYAQLRMSAIIDKIGPKQPDPDNGETYDRLLTTPENAIKLLGWGDVGEKQIRAAAKIAREKFGIKALSTKEEFV